MSGVKPSERFEVTISGSHGIAIPDEIASPFKQAGHDRVKVRAFFREKSIDFHAALQQYHGRFMISFGRRYQKELGVSTNDYFELQMETDLPEYGVNVPEEFSTVFDSDPEAAAIFDSFTDGKKRSLIYYVLRFKNSQTRIDKALMIAENLKMGITDPGLLIKDHR